MRRVKSIAEEQLQEGLENFPGLGETVAKYEMSREEMKQGERLTLVRSLNSNGHTLQSQRLVFTESDRPKASAFA